MFQVRTFPGCNYSTRHGTNTTKKTLCKLRNNNFLKIIEELNYPCNAILCGGGSIRYYIHMGIHLSRLYITIGINNKHSKTVELLLYRLKDNLLSIIDISLTVTFIITLHVHVDLLKQVRFIRNCMWYVISETYNMHTLEKLLCAILVLIKTNYK